MKKKFIVFLLVLLLPIFVGAQEVDKILVSGNNTAYTNKEIDLTFSITYKGLDKKNSDGYGIAGYTYQIDFDDDIFVPVKIKSDDYFDKRIFKDESDKYHIIATINKDNKSKNRCSDNLLYCANVKDTITFVVRNTGESKSSIKVFGSSTYLYKVGSELEESDRMIVDSIQNVQKDLTIKKSSSKNVVVSNAVKSIQSNVIEKTIIDALNNYKKLIAEKSNNNLSKLVIEGYKIEFDKHLLTYDINVPYDVKSLKVYAECESDKATLKIEGNDNLLYNNNVVEITVTAEDGSKKVYKINAVTIDEDANKIETNEDIKAFVSGLKGKINAQTIKILEIVGACLLGIILLIIVIKALSNKKLDKKLKDFDKF